MRLGGRGALALAGIGVDDLAHVDLYSCFPSAVQIAATEIGLGLDRPLTVTGGLSFAGGPWNNYVMHSIATMAGRLREDPGSLGLITANGGYITKHAFGVYSTEPPTEGFRHADPQAEVDALPRRALDEAPDGEMAVETWTAMHDRAGIPETGLLVGLMPDGRRALGTTTDPDLLKVLVTEDVAGRQASIQPDGTTELR
jgi:acetyl-CoA C-acetyltransferase